MLPSPKLSTGGCDVGSLFIREAAYLEVSTGSEVRDFGSANSKLADAADTSSEQWSTIPVSCAAIAGWSRCLWIPPMWQQTDAAAERMRR